MGGKPTVTADGPWRNWRMLGDITTGVILVAPVLILLYDLLAYAIGGHDATITAVIQRWAIIWPELPAIAGGLFFWLWLHLFLNGIVARVNQHLPPIP